MAGPLLRPITAIGVGLTGRQHFPDVSTSTTPAAPLPTVHMNGTGRARLIEGYRNAWESLQTAIEILAKAECHPRDYYVQDDPDAYVKARAQRDQQFTDLHRIQSEIGAILEHLA